MFLRPNFVKISIFLLTEIINSKNFVLGYGYVGEYHVERLWRDSKYIFIFLFVREFIDDLSTILRKIVHLSKFVFPQLNPGWLRSAAAHWKPIRKILRTIFASLVLTQFARNNFQPCQNSACVINNLSNFKFSILYANHASHEYK